MRIQSPPSSSPERRQANQEQGNKPANTRVRAKPIRPGTIYHISVATLEHRMFLNPDGSEQCVNHAFAAELARYAKKFEILVHGFVVMSNHYHLVATDQFGHLPAFKAALHGIGARMVNAERGRFGKMWSETGSCDEVLLDDEDVMRSLVYDLTNPAKAELVKWGCRWPGAISYGVQWGETMRFRVSEKFRGRGIDSGEERFTEIQLVRPNIFPELSDEELFCEMMNSVREAEQTIQAGLHGQPRRFSGENRIIDTHWDKRAKCEKRRERFLVKPMVAAADTAKRVAYFVGLKLWRLDYAAALESLRNGAKTIFPFGTYLMRIRASVTVSSELV